MLLLFEEYQAKTKGIVKNSTSHANDIDLNLDNLNVSNFLSDYDSFVNDTIETNKFWNGSLLGRESFP